MRLFVGVTDSDWYTFLSGLPRLDEANFWQPSGNVRFNALKPGEPFLFKLHSPNDFVVGGGFFGHFSILPVSLAWEAFGEKNGARTEEEMRARVEKYRREQNPAEDYNVGCILLERPFFLRREDWLAVPDWSRSIVRGKGYDTHVEPGKSLWNRVEMLLVGSEVSTEEIPEIATSDGPRYGTPQTMLPRLGQGSFRIIVTDAYQRHCAVTRSPILYVLDAAHIKSYEVGGPHSVTNGILLRKDVHTLFDRGYMTVTPEHRLHVSKRIREEFDNGKEYYALHGSEILLPHDRREYPGPEYLEWHNQSVYRD